MYEYLTGVVTFINPYYIVVEANGIGYQIALGNPYRYSSQMNKEVKIYVHQVICIQNHINFGTERNSCFNLIVLLSLPSSLASISGTGQKQYWTR